MSEENAKFIASFVERISNSLSSIVGKEISIGMRAATGVEISEMKVKNANIVGKTTGSNAIIYDSANITTAPHETLHAAIALIERYRNALYNKVMAGDPVASQFYQDYTNFLVAIGVLSKTSDGNFVDTKGNKHYNILSEEFKQLYNSKQKSEADLRAAGTTIFYGATGKNKDKSPWTTELRERSAIYMERYIYDGVLPENAGLAQLFKPFADTIKTIYNNAVKQLRMYLNTLRAKFAQDKFFNKYAEIRNDVYGYETPAAVKTFIDRLLTGYNTELNEYIGTIDNDILLQASADAVATDNYVLKSEVGTGTFTIKKKSVTILANAGEKVYDGVEPKFNKETDFTVLTPLVGEDAVTSVTLYKEAGVDAGTYDVTPSNAQGISEDYYKINYMVGTYTITPRRLTKIQIANQTINLNQNETNLDKNKVTFTADNYTLTADDITKLKSEFDYEFTTATATDAEAGPFANRIRIKYHGTGAAAKFTNFSLPIKTGTTEIDLAATQTIADKYILGALTIKGNAGAAAVLFADDATVAEEKVASLINTYKGQKINVEVELNRSQALGTTNCNWAAEKWNTLCLPFDVTVRELSNQLGYAIVNVVDASKTTTGNVQFKLQMAGTIKANTPFVVKTDEAIADGKVLAFAGKTIEQGSASVDAGCGYEFVGVYDTKTLNKADSKLSFLRGNGEKWVFIGESSENTWNLVPMTAYIDLTPATNAHEVTFTMQEADGSTTVIRNISAETASKLNAEGWYTINGMKLNAAPTEKGIYINNGKKVVLK